MPVSSLYEYIFSINIGRKINKINIVRKNIKVLIPFRKIQPCKLSLQREEPFMTFNNLQSVMTL